MIKRIVNVLESLLQLNKATETLLVDVLASYAPWLAPFSTAFLIYQSLITNLGYPGFIAFSTAAAVEVLGLSSIQTVLTFSDWNRESTKTAPKAPVIPAIIAGVLYFSVILALIILLDKSGPNEKLAKCVMAMLSISAAFVISLRAAHAKRVKDFERESQERRAERRALQVTQVTPQVAQVAKYDWRELTLDEKIQISKMNQHEIMNIYAGIPESTSRHWMKLAAENGFHEEVK
jgi:hypothetical protein